MSFHWSLMLLSRPSDMLCAAFKAPTKKHFAILNAIITSALYPFNRCAVLFQKEVLQTLYTLMNQGLSQQRSVIMAGHTAAGKFMENVAEKAAPELDLSLQNVENKCLIRFCLKELQPQSTIIPDNATFHKKEDVYEIAKKYGHYVLFLPPYSPDFNPIEKDFANIKKIRAYDNENSNLDDIVKKYGN